MLLYWFIFLVPAYFLVGKVKYGSNIPKLEWLVLASFLIILIGLRNKIGCDWLAYLEGLELVKVTPWDNFYNLRESGYDLLSRLSLATGANIYGINFVCAAIFVGGLISLSRSQPYPWLSILMAIPYLVIVVAMGYTRQATAIGFLMYGFGYLSRGRLTTYLIFVLLAGLFHKTAFIFFALAFFWPGSGKLKGVLGVCFLVSLVGMDYLFGQAENFMLNYVENTMESDGGKIRIYMNILPALIFFGYWKKWKKIFIDRWLWGIISLLTMVCVPLVFIASTAVDRMALYLIPLQLVVLARFPVLVQGSIERTFAVLMVILYCAIVQFTWLVYGTHSSCWVPYDNLLFPPY